MKQFFKISPLKIILSFVIIVLDLFSRILYARGIGIINENLEFQGNIVVKILYSATNTILFPVKEFGKILGASREVTSLSFPFIIFIIIYIFYIYLVSSILSFFIEKRKKKGQAK